MAAPSVGEDEGDGRGLGCLLGVAGAAPWPLAPLPLALALATADAVSAIVPERAAVPGVLRLAAADIADLRKRRGLCQYSVKGQAAELTIYVIFFVPKCAVQRLFEMNACN